MQTTVDRVPAHTSEEVNERIRRQTEMNICYHSCSGRSAIDQRLAELDEEWDIERALETSASSVTLLSLTMSLLKPRWRPLPFIVAGFLLQHALQGWCPPLPILRRLGFRTQREIDEERFALKVLRGDFSEAPEGVEQGGRLETDLRRVYESVRK